MASASAAVDPEGIGDWSSTLSRKGRTSGPDDGEGSCNEAGAVESGIRPLSTKNGGTVDSGHPSDSDRPPVFIYPDPMFIEGDYEGDGAVCVRQLFTATDIELATEAIEANLSDLSLLAKRASVESDGAFVEDFCSWQRIPELEQFIRQSPAAELAATLTGSSTIRLYHDHVLVKEPGTKQRTPWHQDQPYYNVDGFQNTSMWLPVDPVPRSSTLEFIAGTHRGSLVHATNLSGRPCLLVPGRNLGRDAGLCLRP